MTTEKKINYVEVFQEAEKELQPSKLYGNLLLVRIIGRGEIKTKSNLVIASDFSKHQVNSINSSAAVFAEVLRVGEGYYDDDGVAIPVDVCPGDIISFGVNAAPELTRYGDFITNAEGRLAYVRSSEIMEHFESQEKYEKYFNFLRERLS